MQISKEPLKMKYKNNIRIETENNDVIRINRDGFKYTITGFDKDLNLLPTKTYQTLDGVKKYMFKTYNVELE